MNLNQIFLLQIISWNSWWSYLHPFFALNPNTMVDSYWWCKPILYKSLTQFMSVFLLMNYDHHYHPVLYVEWYIYSNTSPWGWGISVHYCLIWVSLSGLIKSNLCCIPPNPEATILRYYMMNHLATLSLGLHIESNLIHTPLGPLYIRVQILNLPTIR